MIIERSLTSVSYRKDTVLTVGTFDGVHRAHQQIISEVKKRAEERGGRSVIVTFDPHPKTVLAQYASSSDSYRVSEIELLTTTAEKLEHLARLNVDMILVIPFTYEFSRMSFRDFYQTFIIDGIGVSEVIEGYDHGFGRDRKGGLEQLIQLGREFDFTVVAEKPIVINNHVVSSSKIRSLLAQGDIAAANMLLGRRYEISGLVVKGEGRGKTLGFPTANIEPSDPKKMLPANGIYAGIFIDKNQSMAGLISIGTKPTFYAHHPRSCEIFLYQYEGNLYGHEVTIECIERIRNEEKFASANELVAAMISDKEKGKEIFKKHQITIN